MRMASAEQEMSSYVAVLSNIPKLTACLKNAMPNLLFRDVSHGPVCLHNIFKAPAEGLVSEDALRILQECEIIVADCNLLVPLLHDLPNAKWIQVTWAGVDPISKAYNLKKLPLPYVLTRFSGPLFGVQMSEYVVANIVNRERSFMSLYESQKIHKWDKDEFFMINRSIQDLTIGILGLGAIGKDIAKVLKALNATVWGVGRTPLQGDTKIPFVDEYRLMSDLPEVLSSCDYIICILPETKETTGLLGGDLLKHCANRKTVLINIGRGNIITEPDLLRALNEGWLGGAILDVFPVEPLPTDSPLWDMPQVIISPHIAGITRRQDVAIIFKENYERYKSGKPLLHVLDFSKGY